MRPGSSFAVVVAFVATFGAGCGSLSEDLRLCGQIPEGGCPLGRGGSCEDTECAGLYDCVSGAWTLARTCQGGGEGGSGGGASGEGGSCSPLALDHTGEDSGCTPDLQSPDCPAVAAETCVVSACLTECTDFFLCTPAGWSLVAFCEDDGTLVIVQ